jgi:hypothetical protein
MFVIQHPAIAREAQYLRIPGSSLSTSSDRPKGADYRACATFGPVYGKKL